MILPVGVGIYAGISAGIVAPLVDFFLRESSGYTIVGTCLILDFHVIGIVADDVETLGHGFK